MTTAQVLALAAALWGLHPAPPVAESIARLTVGDRPLAALALVVCEHESSLGTARSPHLLCGAHVRGADGLWDRSPDAQVGAVVRRFRGARREGVLRFGLLAWRCGRDARCRAVAGPLYVRSILVTWRMVLRGLR